MGPSRRWNGVLGVMSETSPEAPVTRTTPTCNDKGGPGLATGGELEENLVMRSEKLKEPSRFICAWTKGWLTRTAPRTQGWATNEMSWRLT